MDCSNTDKTLARSLSSFFIISSSLALSQLFRVSFTNPILHSILLGVDGNLFWKFVSILALVHPFFFLVLRSSHINFIYSSYWCSSALHFTCPNHPSLFSTTLSSTGLTPANYFISSFLKLSFLVIVQIYLNILIHALINMAIYDFLSPNNIYIILLE